MFETQKLKLASILYKNAFPLYRMMYFNFKKKKDAANLSIIKQLLTPTSNVLDIGANIGFYSVQLAEQTGAGGKVYCFEPDAVNFKHLQKETKSFKQIELFQKAVAAENGKLTLYTSDLLNIDHRTYEPESYSGKYDVEKISIDSFIQNKFKVDFIKMDIQGFEMDALNGMQETLKANNDLVMLTEFWPYGLQQAGSSAVAVFDFFTKLDFKVYQLIKNKLQQLTRDEVLAMKVDFLSDTNVWISRKSLAHIQV